MKIASFEKHEMLMNELSKFSNSFSAALEFFRGYVEATVKEVKDQIIRNEQTLSEKARAIVEGAENNLSGLIADNQKRNELYSKKLYEHLDKNIHQKVLQVDSKVNEVAENLTRLRATVRNVILFAVVVIIPLILAIFFRTGD